jgi:hypothetical protein
MNLTCSMPGSVSSELEPRALDSDRRFATEGQQYVLEGKGTVVTAQCRIGGGIKPVRRGGGMRGPVSKFSRDSCKHLLFALHEIPWDAISAERLYFLRVTDVRPTSHRGFGEKECLALLHRRMNSFFGKDGFWAVWKQEYADNGHWHAHIIVTVLRLPKRLAHSYGVARGDLPPSEFEQDFPDWLTHTWAKVLRISRKDDIQEAAYCQRVRDIHKVINYVLKGPFGSAKAYETRTPEGFKPNGRWWGKWHVACIPEEGERLTITKDAFYEVRRVLQEVPARRNHGPFRPGVWSRTSPMKIISDGPDMKVFHQVCQYVAGLRSQEGGKDHPQVGLRAVSVAASSSDPFYVRGNAYALVDERFGARVLTSEGDKNE